MAEQKLLRTAAITADARRTEGERFRRRRVKGFGPVRDARKNFWRSGRHGKQIRTGNICWTWLCRPGRNFWRKLVNIAALNGWVQEHVFDEDGNFVLLL